MSTGNPPAGYYADPSIPGYIRYWDGAEWVAGTSRPAPEEAVQDAARQAAGQEPAAAQPDAAAGRSSSGAWQPEPAATSQAGQPDPLGRSAGRSQSGARGYAQSPATTAGPSPAPAQVPQQGRHSRTGDELPQQYAESAQQYAEPARQQAPLQPQQPPAMQWPTTAAPPAPAQLPRQLQPQQLQPQPVQPQSLQAQPLQPQQYAQRSAPVPAVQPQPEPLAQQLPESVATMIVPSAFAPSQRTGTYRLPGNINNPFAGLPGSPDFGSAVGQDEEEGVGEATVVELATPGSRFLGRIIDIGIAAVFSAPITVTLLLIAHRHDHQYVLKLDSQATTTYTTLGMDGIGIAMWAGALLAFLVVSIVYEGYRLGRGGQTFGKRLAGVRVVKLADGNPLDRGGAGTRRALLFWVFAIIPVVDVLTLGGVLWGRPYRQGVHERATSTVTIKV